MHIAEWPHDHPAPTVSISRAMARDIEDGLFEWSVVSKIAREQQEQRARPQAKLNLSVLQPITVHEIGRSAIRDDPSGPAFWIFMGLFSIAGGALVIAGLPPLLRLALRVWGGLS